MRRKRFMEEQVIGILKAGSPPPPPRRARPRRTPDGVARRHLPLPLRAHRILEKLAALIPRPAVNLLLYHGVLASRALALPGRPLRPPRPRRCRPHARGPPRGPHPRLDLGGVDAPYARSRCPRLAPLWRPAAHRRHHPGSGTSCAPSSPTSTWRRAPTSPAPPPALPHRRHPVTRGRRSQPLPDDRQHQPPGPRSAHSAALDHRRVPSAPSPQGVGAQRRRVRAFLGASPSAPWHSPAVRAAPPAAKVSYAPPEGRGAGRGGAESSQRTSRLLDKGARRVQAAFRYDNHS